MLRNCFDLRGKICSLLFLCTLSSSPVTQAQQSGQKSTPKTAPQVEQVLWSYEGQNVTAIELAGQPNLDESDLRSHIVQKEGEPFSRSKIDESIRALETKGGVKDVELEIRPEADGIRVMFVLQPALYFGIYTFPGAQRFPYARLVQVANYPPRGAYSPIDVSNTHHALLNFFQQNGYFQAEVHPQIETDDAHGLVNMEYRVALHRHAKFGKIILDGAPPELNDELQRSLQSTWARIRGVAIRRGKSYSYRTVQKAPDYLEGKLIDKNYLGGSVELASAEYDPATNRADVHFKVTPGQLAYVKVEGAHLWSWTQRGLLPIYQQAGLDPETIQEGKTSLASYFQSKGYFDVKVVTQTQRAQKRQDIVYRVTKGPRHSVENVEIIGNHALSDSELRSYIAVKKEGFPSLLNHGKFSDALVRKSVDNLSKAYKAEGFGSVRVTPDIEKKGGDIKAKFRIEEGPRDVVARLRLEGNKQVPLEKLVPNGLKAAEGQPYSAKRVDEDRNQIVAQYLRMGYLNASFRSTASKVNNNPHRLEVLYHITEGPRVIINSVVTLGTRSTRQSVIHQTVRLRPEVPLREDEMFGAESRLYNLEIFDWAEVDPRRQITTQTQEDVLVKVHESKANEVRYGFGFEVINRGGNIPSGTVAVPGLPPVGLPSTFKTSEKTFWGPRGSFQYTRRNFRGLAETVSVGLLGARLVQRAGVSWADPYFIGANWDSNVTISAERNSENPIFTSRYGEFGFQVRRALNAAGSKTLSLRYGYRQTSLTNLLIPDLVPPEDRQLHLSTLAAAYSFDTRDNPLDATRGMYQTADFDMNLRAIGSSVDFARLRAQFARYRSVGAGIVWANSLRIGLAQEFAGSHVPVSELFFSGGGSTLRGFPLNGGGPQRNIPVCNNPANSATCTQIQVPEGGRELFIVNSELRIPIPLKKGLGLATFYDGGNVFRGVGFGGFGSDYSNTVGIGLRYKTPIGPVRIDIGHNLNAPPGLKATQMFITLGQAF